MARWVSMPSRAYTSFLPCLRHAYWYGVAYCVNALSGLYLISTQDWLYSVGSVEDGMCQCPLGLIPHFYLRKRVTKSACSVLRVNALSGLYLISTNFSGSALCFLWVRGVNALSGLYLISTVPLQKPRFYAVSRACFCRYLSEYSDNSRFSCMLTFWTYLMRCTYP